ncbi:hypothetical protein S83_025960 [Arachis hypogaea]
MTQVVEKRENSRTHMSDFLRDLLKRFMSVNHHHHHELQQQHRHGDGDVEQEIELSLGLSMVVLVWTQQQKRSREQHQYPNFHSQNLSSEMKIITLAIIIIKILGVTLITCQCLAQRI